MSFSSRLKPHRALILGALVATSVGAADPQRRPLAEEAASTVKTAVRTDADMRAVLDKMMSFNPRAIETLTPVEARKEPTITDAVMAELKDRDRSVAPEALVPGVSAKDRMIELEGRSLPARIYTPAGAGPGAAPYPVVVYYHGGGFVIADKAVYDGGARGISKNANAIVVSADYRRAPEHKFPAAHNDAYAVYLWTVKNAASMGGDPLRVSLAGESAGGNLALATAMAARDAGAAKPMHVLAVYPVTQTGTDTPSYEKYQDAKPLNRPMMQWFVKHYTRSPEDLKDPRLDLIHADLKGLPPVTIINAEIDPLLDDGALLEAALSKAKVPVRRVVYEGVTHEFFGTAALVEDAKTAQAVAGKALTAGPQIAGNVVPR